MKRESKVEFHPPANLLEQVGESIQPGQNLELMTTFEAKGNGQWCIVSVEGVPFPGYDQQGNPTDGKEEHMPSESAFAKGVMGQMADQNRTSASSDSGGY